MKAPHPVFLAGVELEALGCALRDRQPVAVSGLRLIELAGTATAAAREIRELRAQLEASQIEVQGMRAALDGHAGTHSPYLWTGPAEHHSAWLNGQQAVQKYGADRYQMGYEKAQEIAAVTAGTQILYAEAAEYRDPEKEVTLVGRVFPDGVRIGCQALEPWYGTGVLIPSSHPAYLPAQRFLAALAQARTGDQA